MSTPARSARGVALAVLLVALIACAPFRSGQPDTQASALALRVKPAAFNLEDQAATRVGKLIWRGGITLSADHAAFGGWSDLDVGADGSRVRAVSDAGAWLVGQLRYDPAGRLVGFDNAQLGRLKAPDGTWLVSKAWADAESLATLPDGSLLVGFERRHRVLRYPAGDELQGGGLAGTPRPFPTPAALAGAPANSGLEAMAVLPDGRLLLLAEALQLKPGTTTGWIGTLRDGVPSWSPFHYTLVEGFRPTAASSLPDGDIVLLERTAGLPGGWRVRVMRLRTAALVPDAVVQAEELARLATPWVTENLEGIAARRGRNGETLLWLIADDNFSFVQQTMLLHFALAD
ncbi:esterase-like activity of phytase family protein [Vineibacter terrae]|uniref:esterase-like activity of phytase family protein n=1 Tax=Vineibacter terrae TaxID=2586908 RepID=UPI002E301B44|nr:esterase-like activity of phytase family protein [Vineibacter terrae]HEX2887085.1 esterase-like activity of phytase family protein [Vineibacter terrae]